MNIPFIDLKTQYRALQSDIQNRINNVLEHGGYINGPEVAELEKQLASYCGVKHALACSSGTDALLIPMMALGIGPGDEVITTPFSFVATAETIALAGAQPVYVDIDLKTYNMDVAKIESAITPKTKAIIPVSLYGQVSDMDEINAIAKKHNLFVIEDLAQSFGGTYKGKKSGSLSIAGATSFYPAKPLGCYGDGGAITTDDTELFTAMKEVREHGSPKRYYHTRLGMNGRLDSIQCAILLSKMTRFDWEVDRRNDIAMRYNQAFKEIKKEGFVVPLVKEGNKSVWAQYTLSVPNRDAFQKTLQENGVPTSVHYPLIIPDQPWYKTRLASHQKDVPNARWAAEHVISLPMYPDMPLEAVEKVIEVVRKALA